MNSLSRRILLSAAALLGLTGIASSAAAACPRCQSTTYYQPVTVAAYPGASPCCAPPTSALVPVTVTTSRYGLFGLRQRTTVRYGSPVPVASPAPPVVVPPVASSYYQPALVVPSPQPIVITYP